MKRPWLIVLITLAVALGGYLISYELATRPAKALLAHSNCGVAWLRIEYHLTDAQYTKIAAMHDAYRPTCDRMCRSIAVSNARVNELIASSRTVTPEIEAALRNWALLQNECRLAMLAHVYAVSAEMSPEDGRRYVEMAKARLVASGMAHASLVAKP